MKPLPLMFLLLTACSHDVVRQNLLDPELTPAVTLSVVADDTNGTATLAWSPYDGRAGFAAYRVLRNEADRIEIDTLAVIEDATQTAYVDSGIVPNTSTSYRVEVSNVGGGTSVSATQTVRVGDLDAVRLLDLQFDSATATATMRWSSYGGRNFERYDVIRRGGDGPPVVVAAVAHARDTTLTDGNLHGNIEYSYAITVLTGDGRQLTGASRSGRFHRLVDSFVSDRIARLHATEDGVEKLAFTSIYEKHGVRVALGDLQTDGMQLAWATMRASTVTTAAAVDGRRFLSLVDGDDEGNGETFEAVRWDDVQLLEIDALGRIVPRRTLLFEGVLSDVSAQIESQISLVGASFNAQNREFWLDDVVISSRDGSILRTDDFEADSGPGAPLGWDVPLGVDTAWRGIPSNCCSSGRPLSSSMAKFGNRALRIVTFHGAPEDSLLRLASFTDSTGQVSAVEADVAMNLGGTGGIQLGTEVDGTMRLLLLLDEASDTAQLEWVQRQGGSDQRQMLAQMSHPVAPHGVYRLGLQVTDGQVEAWVERDPLWARASSPGVPLWSSLVAVDEELALTTGNKRYVLSADGDLLAEATLDSPISDTRIWTDPGSGRQMAGVCIPEQDHLKVRALHRNLRGAWVWPTAAGALTIGGRGSADGRMAYPISFDVGPDGRIYVLDAGNSRVQVFSADGSYLTQWGTQGTRPGEFDFGELPVGDLSDVALSGSIAVDDEGFVYVGDRERIQIFAQ